MYIYIYMYTCFHIIYICVCVYAHIYTYIYIYIHFFQEWIHYLEGRWRLLGDCLSSIWRAKSKPFTHAAGSSQNWGGGGGGFILVLLNIRCCNRIRDQNRKQAHDLGNNPFRDSPCGCLSPLNRGVSTLSAEKPKPKDTVQD